MSKVDFSDDEDDPPVYESSGSEWNSEKELEPVRKNSRRSARVSNKKLRLKSSSSSSESDDYEESKPRRRNGFNNKKRKVSVDAPTTPEPQKPTPTITKPLNSKDFSTGSFLILKKDANVGDPEKHPCIWRVDGKALLQKYEPFEFEGQIRHKTTSTYTGWSPLDQDLYAPVTVTVKQHNNHDLIVELNWDKLKEIIMDSE